MYKRQGVVNLIKKYKKQEQKLCKERERIENMRIYERKYAHFSYICGIDAVSYTHLDVYKRQV